jgi:hypothetical protein
VSAGRRRVAQGESGRRGRTGPLRRVVRVILSVIVANDSVCRLSAGMKWSASRQPTTGQVSAAARICPAVPIDVYALLHSGPCGMHIGFGVARSTHRQNLSNTDCCTECPALTRSRSIRLPSVVVIV